MVQPMSGDGIKRAQRQQPRRRGVERSRANDKASLTSRVRGRGGLPTSGSDASEASARKLRDILRQAETKQTADWVRTQHKVKLQ